MININNTPWDKLTFSDIQALLAGFDGESFFFEFKADEARNQTLHKEISAFANTYGGYILLGISDNKEITGCNAWNEQRIHNVIYNGITPTPDFDLKMFEHDGKTIYVIKIEEGSMPPYITTDGKIFERVSSASMPITDSSKLSQLYIKHTENLTKLNKKIGIEELRPHDYMPPNLCAYLDLGFEIRCMDRQKLTRNFFTSDFSKVGDLLREKGGKFSISNVGNTYVITLGEIRAAGATSSVVLPEAGMHNFLVLMNDGSAKFRICLFADSSGLVELSSIIGTVMLFQDIYKIVFRDKLADNFVYARKYNQLVVLKQFTTYYKENLATMLGLSLIEHIKKYGNNLIVCSNRIPHNDYEVLDRQYFDTVGLSFDADTIISQLFHDAFSFMGFVDLPTEITRRLRDEQKLGNNQTDVTP